MGYDRPEETKLEGPTDMKFTFSNSAPPDTVIAADAYDSNIGKVIDVNGPDGDVLFQARVIAAKVTDGGTWLHVTMDTEDFPVPLSAKLAITGER
jgi:hypothetical protein